MLQIRRYLEQRDLPIHKMKFFVILAALACASADVSHVVSQRQSSSADASAPIVKSDYEISPEGSYQYAYETGNGIAAQANGVVTNPNSDNAAIEVQGSVKYTSPEGVPVVLTYVANQDGYQPQGSHLPVAPPVPELIQRSLQYIAAHPPAPEHGSGVSLNRALSNLGK